MNTLATAQEVDFAETIRAFFKTSDNVERIRQLRRVPEEEREAYFLSEFMEDLRHLINECAPSDDEVESALEHEIKAIFARSHFRDVNENTHRRRIIRS